MTSQLIDFGQRIDVLTKHELREALAEDAAIRAAVKGVKPVEYFNNAGQIGAGVSAYVFPPTPEAGYIWAVMNLGFELSAAGVTRIYKAGGPTPASTPIGGNRFVAQTASTIANNASFSKGQLMLRSGDQLQFLIPGSGNLLSVFMAAIEIPAERVGELLL